MAGPDRPLGMTAWGRIAADLAEAIGDARYQSGDALPTATELAARYGVHRHTARQALRYLQGEGLVSVEPGRGSFVLGQRFSYRLGPRVSFRGNIASSGREASGLFIDAGLAIVPAVIGRELGIDPLERCWRIRTLAFADSIPVTLSVHWFDKKRFPTINTAVASQNGAISKALNLLGISEYGRRVTSVSARLASVDERRLLRLPRGAPVLSSAGVDVLSDGTAFHYVESAFAPDLVEFVVEGEGIPVTSSAPP